MIDNMLGNGGITSMCCAVTQNSVKMVQPRDACLDVKNKNKNKKLEKTPSTMMLSSDENYAVECKTIHSFVGSYCQGCVRIGWTREKTRAAEDV